MPIKLYMKLSETKGFIHSTERDFKNFRVKLKSVIVQNNSKINI